MTSTIKPPVWMHDERFDEWQYRSEWIYGDGIPSAIPWHWACIFRTDRDSAEQKDPPTYTVEVWENDEWRVVAENLPDLDSAKLIAQLNANVSTKNM